MGSTSMGGGTTGGGIANGDATINANEEAATIPAGAVGTYAFIFHDPFGGSVNGSPYADGDAVEFIVGADGTLTVDGALVLGTPVFRGGNMAEAIWKDTTNGLEYALSTLPFSLGGTDFPLNIREINVSNDQSFSSGFVFYGQFNETP